MSLVLLLLATALAAPGDRAALDAGDRAWGTQDRALARAAWSTASRSVDPAVAAMAETRLWLVTGSVGLAVHGPRADRALARCPTADPWCLLAAADYELMLAQVGLPFDLDHAIALATTARDALPGPAVARLVWAGTAPVDSLDDAARDGLGDALLHNGGHWPSGPGTWMVGLGVAGASGAGIGGTVRFVHPDLRWRQWRLGVTGSLTSAGAGALDLALTTPGRWWSTGSLTGARGVYGRWDDDGLAGFDEVWTARAAAAPGLRRGAFAAWLGPVARTDWPTHGEPVAGHGLFGGLRADPRGDSDGDLTLSGEASLTGQRFGEATADLRVVVPSEVVTLAGRIVSTTVVAGDPPAWRVPALGGGAVLRSGPWRRWQAPTVSGAVLELRRDLGQVFGGVAFAEVAWAEGLHGGGGGGLRLHLPPKPLNTVRFDVAGGDGGLGITAGWGEAF